MKDNFLAWIQVRSGSELYIQPMSFLILQLEDKMCSTELHLKRASVPASPQLFGFSKIPFLKEKNVGRKQVSDSSQLCLRDCFWYSYGNMIVLCYLLIVHYFNTRLEQ